MSACAHRMEDGCSLIPCATACEGRKCLCSVEVKQDEAEEETG